MLPRNVIRLKISYLFRNVCVSTFGPTHSPRIKLGAILQGPSVVHGQHISTFRLHVTNFRLTNHINFQFVLVLTTTDHDQQAEKAKNKRRYSYHHRVSVCNATNRSRLTTDEENLPRYTLCV